MANVRGLSRVLPSVQVTLIPDADHATAQGHPKFVEALLAFLLRQKGTTRGNQRSDGGVGNQRNRGIACLQRKFSTNITSLPLWSNCA